MLRSTNCASSWSAPLPGRINSNVCCCALRLTRFIILDSNSSPSCSSTSESFVGAETCNQFISLSMLDFHVHPDAPTIQVVRPRWYPAPQQSADQFALRQYQLGGGPESLTF